MFPALIRLMDEMRQADKRPFIRLTTPVFAEESHFKAGNLRTQLCVCIPTGTPAGESRDSQQD